MSQSAYDCIVIGSGPGGYVAAIRSAQLGMSTAVVEKGDIGGRCLNVACIPAKAVLRVADILTEVEEAGDFGIHVSEPRVDFGEVGQRRQKVVDTLTGGVSGLMKKNGIDVIAGFAKLTADGDVEVDGQTIAVNKGVILATGSVGRPIPGTQFGGRVIGTEEAWALDTLPAALAVVGAGASGAEIASAYARLGVKVQLFEGLDRVLPSEDADISKVAERGFKKQGIEVKTKTFVENVQPQDDRVTFTYGGTDGEADYLVIAAGRGPDVEGLGLDAAGVELTEAGLIEVDGTQMTSKERVYAIGDLVPGPALAHKASDEGVIAAEAIHGDKTHPISYPTSRARRSASPTWPRSA
jgi:dihydrolipoamide dehydrogenase